MTLAQERGAADAPRGTVSELIEARIREAWQREDYHRAAALLIDGYGRQIRNYLAGMLRSRSRVDEAYSMFTVDVLVGLPRFRWECRAKVFAYRLAHNAAYRYLRSERRYERLPDEVLCDLPAQPNTRTASYLKTDVKSRMRALRERLSVADQELLTLHVDRELTFKEIARTLLENGLTASDPELEREESRLRSQFRWIKKRLVNLAVAEGLL
jgi:RNA polymerase sigma-70 factor (ECF subfamily)